MRVLRKVGHVGRATVASRSLFFSNLLVQISVINPDSLWKGSITMIEFIRMEIFLIVYEITLSVKVSELSNKF